MAPGIGTLEVMSPGQVVLLLLLLLALERNIAPLVAGVLVDPVISYFQCNICFRAQVRFPWPARSQQTAFATNWMHCLPRYARVLIQLQSECPDWFNVWFLYCTLKSNRFWCLFKSTVVLHCGGLLCSFGIQDVDRLHLPYPTRPPFWDRWGAMRALQILGWSVLSWTVAVWYPVLSTCYHVGG